MNFLRIRLGRRFTAIIIQRRYRLKYRLLQTSLRQDWSTTVKRRRRLRNTLPEADFCTIWDMSLRRVWILPSIFCLKARPAFALTLLTLTYCLQERPDLLQDTPRALFLSRLPKTRELILYTAIMLTHIPRCTFPLRAGRGLSLRPPAI